MHSPHQLRLRNGQSFTLGSTPRLMGILNITPDSFSDGGEHLEAAAAAAFAASMVAEGADIIDVGGESTRPGAEEVSAQGELDRVMPVLDAIGAAGTAPLISIDTYKALVAHQAIEAGAGIINDVYGLQRDPEIADVAALFGVPVVAMHWDKSRDRDKPLLDEMRRYFDRTLAIAGQAGIAREQIVLDPGFGFGKTLAENYALLRDLPLLAGYGLPLLIGISRKSMLGKILGNQPQERLPATLATSVIAYQQGGHIFRVHDIGPNRDALRIAQATLYGPDGDS